MLILVSHIKNCTYKLIAPNKDDIPAKCKLKMQNQQMPRMSTN